MGKYIDYDNFTGKINQAMHENDITSIIIAKSIKVHSLLGPGLLESAYKEALYFYLLKEQLFIEKEKPMPLLLEEVKLDVGYRIDLLVEQKVVIEVKSVETLHPVHTAQVITYLKLGNYKVGLLINFNEPTLKAGLKRIANGI